LVLAALISDGVRTQRAAKKSNARLAEANK